MLRSLWKKSLSEESQSDWKKERPAGVSSAPHVEELFL